MIKEYTSTWRKYANKLFEEECRIPSVHIVQDRSDQPQIAPEMYQDFILFLREQGIESFKTRVPVAELVGSQETVDCDKVKAMASQPNSFEKLSQGTPIFVSQDHIIADGHTRTQALRLVDKNADLPVWEVQCEIGQLLQSMKRFLDTKDQHQTNSDF